VGIAARLDFIAHALDDLSELAGIENFILHANNENSAAPY